jgi:methionyl-tRNA synthetase
MPETSMKMAAALGLSPEIHENQNLLDHGGWGLTQPDTKIKLGDSLFPRLDRKSRKAAVGATAPQKTSAEDADTKKQDDALISFDDFKKVDLRVAEILTAEKIEKSDRLLKLKVAAPEERTVVAGIAEYYDPQELIGRQVILVANLKPAKLMGVASHGMILAAYDKQGGLTLAVPVDPVAPGSKIS